MSLRISTLSLSLLLLYGQAEASSTDANNINKLLDCISHLETGARLKQNYPTSYDKKIGTSGEISRYQVLPKVWKQYSTFKAVNYQNPNTAYQVARRILIDRINSYRNVIGRNPTAFEVYICWNAPSFYYRKNQKGIPKTIRSKAERFRNLYETN